MNENSNRICAKNKGVQARRVTGEVFAKGKEGESIMREIWVWLEDNCCYNF